jgi:hypothetical protein
MRPAAQARGQAWPALAALAEQILSDELGGLAAGGFVVGEDAGGVDHAADVKDALIEVDGFNLISDFVEASQDRPGLAALESSEGLVDGLGALGAEGQPARLVFIKNGRGEALA